ncbi:MAG TPA: efflux RND transporter periplasmic adaptor subunit [Anaerolineaceae bacterium]|nr:efflux RND transporter periplasmic adaptor subunit [Anaerolineaceae bacterium]
MSIEKDKGEYEQDFTPKTAKRKINKTTIIIAAIVILLVGLGVAGYFIYEGTFYYQTDNAKVDTTIYQLTANASGKLENMNVNQGDAVKAGQLLARVANGPYIISPIDGTVTDVKMQRGDYALASDVVVVVAETSDMYITANVEETNILKIHTGQSVSVFLDAYGRSFSGTVDKVNTVTSTMLSGAMTSFTTSGTYTKVTQLIPVKIKLLDNVDLANIIGTNATVKIRIK